MKFFAPTIGKTRQFAGREQTLVWCARCCGQGRHGYIADHGLFVTDAGKHRCFACHGSGRIWSDTDVLRDWVQVQDGVEINVLKRGNPIRHFRRRNLGQYALH